MADVDTTLPAGLEKPELYSRLREMAAALVEDERDFIANAANCAALLFQSLPEINWAGFYLLRESDLVLGPFQGKPACVRIGPGRGVCGAAAVRRETVIVPNVREFPGHIACDSASQSEIVVPLLKSGRLIGVLDVDSPVRNRFDTWDAAGLQEIVTVLLAASDDF
jgi:GAF domain-containing protein